MNCPKCGTACEYVSGGERGETMEWRCLNDDCDWQDGQQFLYRQPTVPRALGLQENVDALAAALLPIIQQALGMKVHADHGTVVRLTEAEINAGKAALEKVGRWPYRMWEKPNA